MAVSALPAAAIVRAHANVTGESVSLTDAVGGTWHLLAEWLRDNCRCDLCRIVQTDERRFRPWEQAAAHASRVDAVDGALVVEWADGHRSTFGVPDFATLSVLMERGRHEPRLWRAGHEVTRVDHDSVVADDDARRTMLEALRDEGAVILGGSPTVPGSIIETCNSIGLTLVDSPLGFIFDVMLDPAGFNVAYTSEALVPHNDNAQYRYPPSGQVLAMLVNDATGGDSVVVDGFAVLEALEATDTDAVEVLSRVKVGFRQYSKSADNQWRSALVVRDPEGGYARLRFSNQLRQPLDPGHPDLADWYRAYRLLGNLVCDPQFAVSFRLDAGDSLFVHGDRVLHARNAFTPDGPRHLQDVYFNIDDVHGTLDRMAGAAPDAMWSPATAGVGQ
jgi:gamma-butyrobetaine dioxygenase